ncbi:MAG: MBL fold metallo-hydrolase [Pseudomonadota bacterium]
MSDPSPAGARPVAPMSGDISLRAADPWFAIEPQPNGILRIWEPHVSRLLRANMFLVRGRDRDLLVDAGMGVASLRGFLEPLLERPVTCLLTHGHVDHVGSAAEFADDLRMHAAEAHLVASPPDFWTLSYDDYPPEKRAGLAAAGFDTRGHVIAALPHAGYDPAAWAVAPAEITQAVADGDVIDLGDRQFLVMHLPGHSPGCLVLWEEATGIMIGGDVIYDGLLIDTLPDSNPADYRESMKRLAEITPTVVHGGHRESFGPLKYRRIVADYLAEGR